MTDFDTREEFTKMAEAGMTFRDILASLTTTPARWRGFAASSGQIAVGFDADLTAITGDPAAAVAAFARVSCTIRRGRVIYAAGRR